MTYCSPRPRFLLVAIFVSLLIGTNFGCGSGSSTATNTQPVTITASPTTATVSAGANATFTATVMNASVTAVTWSVQEGASGGTITSAGVYTAPSTPGTYHVVATAQADPTKTAIITVTVVAAVSVSVTPPTATLGIGESQTFTATVNNTSNTGVTWSVQEASGGTVTSAGAYTAPLVAGTYHVIATSAADTTKSASATITVTAPNPTFTSTAPTVASEGTLYTYNMAATDPAGTAITFELTTGPAGASVSGSTLTWTPTSAQSRVADAFTVTAKTAAGGIATQSWSVTPLGIIRGSRIVTYISDSATVTAPAPDVATADIAAYVPDGAGGFTTIIGNAADANGNFAVEGVPAGSFWLQVGNNYVWTSASNLDLGYNQLGRSDAVVAPFGSGTMVSFSLTNLASWNQNDVVELFASNADAYQNFQYSLTNPNGSTTLTDTVPYQGFPLPDAAKGDQTYVTQLSTITSGPGIGFQSLIKVMGPLSLTMPLGATTAVSGAMTDVPQNSTFRGNIKGSAFTALAAATGPVTTIFNSLVDLQLQPEAAKGYFGVAPDLLYYNPPAPGFATDVDLGDIPYGNPYPSAWTPFFDYAQFVSATWKAPGATTSQTTLGSVELVSTTFPTATAPIQPIVGPPANPTINGASLLFDQTGVGLTPQLRWDAPALGPATGYKVLVYGLSKSNTGGTVITRGVGFLYTTATSITLPPGLLQAGSSYGIEIDAVSDTGVDYSVNPVYRTFPFGTAPVFSGAITP